METQCHDARVGCYAPGNVLLNLKSKPTGCFETEVTPQSKESQKASDVHSDTSHLGLIAKAENAFNHLEMPTVPAAEEGGFHQSKIQLVCIYVVCSLYSLHIISMIGMMTNIPQAQPCPISNFQILGKREE